MTLRPSDISASRVGALNAGEPAANLAESLSIDFAKLMSVAVPSMPRDAIASMRDNAETGITRRISLAAELISTHAPRELDRLASHPSDTVRGWACYAITRAPALTLAQRLTLVRPFADDPHSGVREWAWMAVRDAVGAEILSAIELLTPWTAAHSPNIRRFATEVTRPRGVWCSHIRSLRTDPTPALPLLEPLREDPTKYVQDSVSNWLNDAAKDNPAFVRELTTRWNSESPCKATARICRRAVRSID
jgi:3-methyladenine DNA glycosylase AlkC